MTTQLDRRRFLAASAALALARAGRAAPAAAPRGRGAERTLVLLQLSGGNDGLSTVVPFAHDRYHSLRPGLALGKDEVLPLDDERALNGRLERLHATWQDGRLALVEGVGYPDATRSHFSSMDVWHAADARGRAAGEGWVGRLVEHGLGGGDEPNLVIHVGAEVPFSLHSPTHPPASFVIPRSYRWAGGPDEVAAYERIAEHADQRPADGSNLDYLRGVLRDGQASSELVRRAAAEYRTEVAYPSSRLGAALHDAAAMIAGRIGTRVLSVELNGFDTHDEQRGRHAGLMGTLDAALGAFLEDLERTEEGRETAVLLFSEFGRRVEENGTGGTDHGLAGPVLVVGPGVRGGLHGAPPSLDELQDGDLAHTTDFRRVYASLIEDWLGLEAAPVLGAGFEPLPDLFERPAGG